MMRCSREGADKRQLIGGADGLIQIHQPSAAHNDAPHELITEQTIPFWETRITREKSVK